MTRFVPGGRAEVKGVPLNMLVRIAYASDNIQTLDQVVGGPGWVRSDRWDIVAKAEGDPKFDSTGRPMRFAEMLKTLLQDRFRLRVHTEMRQATVYALVTSNGARPSAGLRSSTVECSPPQSRPTSALADTANQCSMRATNGTLRGTGISMTQLATTLASFPVVGRPVIDRTGLTGTYDFELEFGVGDPAGGNGTFELGAALFTTLPDQLGLKLQREQGSIEFLVIDHVEKPTAD